MSAEHLTKLIEYARQDKELLCWLKNGLDDWQNNNEPLDKALGLTGKAAQIARDAALRKVAVMIDPQYQLSTWARAGRLEKELLYFESTTWARIRRHGEYAISSEYKQALLAVFTICKKTPMIFSQRKLFDVLTD